MKFFRLESGFVHVQDCLTREKAERIGAGWQAATGRKQRITPLEIEEAAPHFDAEDLETIRTTPVYRENIGHLLPLLYSGRARNR